MNLTKIRIHIEKEKGKLQQINKKISSTLSEIRETEKDIKRSKKIKKIIDNVAQATQSQIKFRISNIVTRALQLVFADPYEFEIDFVLKRGRTECSLYFLRDGKRFDPIEESGGGAIDVAAFALRLSLWSLNPEAKSNILVFDEPFKNINDKTRILHRNVASMVQEISRQLKIQVIIVSAIPEFEDVANKIFHVRKNKGVSTVTSSRCP